ncbi:hypothetical protein Desor_3061 [Desulfosporosinus orientis DSM 765]|uniref:Uncharacterized protein n=1 Tax=Desulfosporosinus orientis (strain ATCC 19365 / DSM 765 / NCIMB 8382 / VKM B-1628 / Singapore I) TaxID=768706 RepID=G7WID3_DESOD|nr:hypothetical protein [Desulfosporosinus orientis]AET68581.1 hypothetical protein Desor_3061 [Desulfosporosinus orientis DSM 765]
MPIYFTYLLYTSILALLAVILVSRKDIHKYAFLGIFYGAVIDIFWIVLLSLIDGGGYLNYGPLGFLNIPFMPPIAWTIYFILFLNYLPDKKPWNYSYAAIAVFYSVIFSNVLTNLGIFHWTFSNIILPIAIYLSWFLFTVWHYEKFGKKFIEYGIKP